MNQITSDISRIHSLIDRYFDATATEAEERELRILLSDPALSSKKIDEARAVIGFFAVDRAESVRVSTHKISRGGRIRAAAAVALTIACGLSLLHIATRHNHTNQCYAYIGDQKITDKDRVLSIMHADLSMLGEASQSLHSDVETQLSSLANELSL